MTLADLMKRLGEIADSEGFISWSDDIVLEDVHGKPVQILRSVEVGDGGNLFFSSMSKSGPALIEKAGGKGSGGDDPENEKSTQSAETLGMFGGL